GRRHVGVTNDSGEDPQTCSTASPASHSGGRLGRLTGAKGADGAAGRPQRRPIHKEGQPMANAKPSDLAPEALLAEVASRSDSAGATGCSLIPSGLNAVSRVPGAAKPYVLKVYRAGWKSEKDVLEEAAVLRHVEQKGVPVALPVATRGGAFTWTPPALEEA